MSTISFFVEGQPVPWGMGQAVKGGRRIKSKRLVEWQATMRQVALLAKARHSDWELTSKPVKFSSTFYLKKPAKCTEPYPTRRSGKRAIDPDLGNLEKAAEDALQGVIYVNDSQIVRRGEGAMFWAERHSCLGVRITVETVE